MTAARIPLPVSDIQQSAHTSAVESNNTIILLILGKKQGKVTKYTCKQNDFVWAWKKRLVRVSMEKPA